MTALAATPYKQPTVETFTGRRFGFYTFDIDLADMLAALPKLCRYTGQCAEFYSVAEHSVLCAKIARHFKLCDPREAFLHDFHEAYTNDVNGQWKSELPDFRRFEKRVEVAVRRYFGLRDEITAGCKDADLIALLLEARQLFASRGAQWGLPRAYHGYADDLLNDGWKLDLWQPREARERLAEAAALYL